MCVDAPDMSGQRMMAETSYELGKEQLGIQRDLLDYYRQRQVGLDQLTGDVTRAQLGIQQQTADQGADYYGYAKETFRPVEASIVAQVMKDSTPEEYARLASAASARTGVTFRNLAGASERAMRSMGVNPSSGRAAGLDRTAMLEAAVQGAKAYNDAYTAAGDKGYARKLDAAGLGRNLAGASTAAYGAATAAGSAAAGAGNDASRTAGSTIGTPTQYGQLGISSMGNAVSAYDSVARGESQGGLDSGFGTLLGVGLGMWNPFGGKKGT